MTLYFFLSAKFIKRGTTAEILFLLKNKDNMISVEHFITQSYEKPYGKLVVRLWVYPQEKNVLSSLFLLEFLVLSP